MKRVILLALVIIFAIAAFGCSKTDGILKQDEFSVYKDGKLFMEIPRDDVLYVGLDTEFERGALHEYDGQIFTTKRGLTIGDSIDKVNRSYKGISLLIYERVSGEELTFDEVLKDGPSMYEIRFSTLIIDDKFYDGLRSGVEFMDELEVDFKEWNEIKRFESKDYKVEEYAMQIIIKDNKVYNIILSGMSSAMMNK